MSGASSSQPDDIPTPIFLTVTSYFQNSGHQSIPSMASVSSVGSNNSATSVASQNAPSVAPPNPSPAPGHDQNPQQQQQQPPQHQGNVPAGVLTGPMPQQQQPGGVNQLPLNSFSITLSITTFFIVKNFMWFIEECY